MGSEVGHGDLDALWRQARQILTEIQDLRIRAETLDHKQSKAHTPDHEQLKTDFESVFGQCRSCISHVLNCSEWLSANTVKCLAEKMEFAAKHPLEEGDEMLQDIRTDIHEMERDIENILEMQNPSRTQNPYLVWYLV